MSPLDAAAQVVYDYPGGPESLAPRLSKGLSSLRAELHPSAGTTAKLGLMTALAITNLTGDPRIVAAFNEACGYCPPLQLPNPAIVDGSMREILERGCELSKEIAETFAEFQRDISDDKVTPNELSAFERKALAAVAAIASLARAMRVKMESDQRQAQANVTPLRSA